jgi:hypothetical protein
MIEIAPDNQELIHLDTEAFLSGTSYGAQRIKQMYSAAKFDGVICECDWGIYVVTDLGCIQNAAGVPVSPLPNVFRKSRGNSRRKWKPIKANTARTYLHPDSTVSEINFDTRSVIDWTSEPYSSISA